MTQLGPLYEAGLKNQPAPIAYQTRHGDQMWCVYDIASGYDIYRMNVPAGPLIFVASYRTKFFAIRRAQKGTLSKPSDYPSM